MGTTKIFPIFPALQWKNVLLYTMGNASNRISRGKSKLKTHRNMCILSRNMHLELPCCLPKGWVQMQIIHPSGPRSLHWSLQLCSRSPKIPDPTTMFITCFKCLKHPYLGWRKPITIVYVKDLRDDAWLQNSRDTLTCLAKPKSCAMQQH